MLIRIKLIIKVITAYGEAVKKIEVPALTLFSLTIPRGRNSDNTKSNSAAKAAPLICCPEIFKDFIL